MSRTPNKSGRRTGRAAFFALREVIRSKVEQGWHVTAIYDEYGEELGLSYSQLARHIRVYILGKASKPRQSRQVALPSG